MSARAPTGVTNWPEVSTAVFQDLRTSSGSQDDAIWWDEYLQAGTWAFTLHFNASTNRGIYTLEVADLDAAGNPGSFTTLGTIDGYAGAGTSNNGTLTGLSIATAGHKRVRLRMASKNASSSAYYGAFAAGFLRLVTPS